MSTGMNAHIALTSTGNCDFLASKPRSKPLFEPLNGFWNDYCGQSDPAQTNLMAALLEAASVGPSSYQFQDRWLA